MSSNKLDLNQETRFTIQVSSIISWDYIEREVEICYSTIPGILHFLPRKKVLETIFYFGDWKVSPLNIWHNLTFRDYSASALCQHFLHRKPEPGKPN